MREALADPVFGAATPPLADLRLAASNAPALARAFLDLHRAYRQTHERLASLDEALGREDAALRPSPWEEVRDFFHYCDNYIDAVDRAAEHFAARRASGSDPMAAAHGSAWPRAASTLHVFRHTGTLRHYDPRHATLDISARAGGPTQRFQLLHQVALLHPERPAGSDAGPCPVPDARGARHRQDRAGQLLRRGRPAALPRLPAGRRARRATIWNGWPTLRRLDRTGGAPAVHAAAAGRQGHPVLLRARRSGGHDHQAPFGHAAAIRALRRRLPAVERAPAFETPGHFLRQLAETPDGVRYLCLARDVSKPGGGFRRAGPPLCHRSGLRGAARRRAGLCRRARPDGPVRADRHLLPDLRAARLPPAVGPAAGAAAAGQPRPPRNSCPTRSPAERQAAASARAIWSFRCDRLWRSASSSASVTTSTRVSAR